MNDHDIKGIRVISVADAHQLGTLERAFLDPAERKVVGFGYHASGGFLKPESNPLIDTTDIQSFSTDVLTLANEAMVRGERTTARYAQLIDLSRLHGEKIVTEDGRSLGSIHAVEFDEHSYKLTGVTVSAGHFESNTVIAADDIVTIGTDVTVVRNTVAERQHAPTPDAPSVPFDAGDQTGTATPFQEQTIEIPISGEHLDLRREIERNEDVAITKEAVERDQSVTETVQREEVIVEPTMNEDAVAEEARESTKRTP